MKLSFNSLQFQKAFTYVKPVTIPLANQGIVLLKGLNLDDPKKGSNGVGKSAVWEVLSHILFAITGRKLRKNAILTEWSPTDYLATLEVQRDEKALRIQQYREHSDLGTGVSIWDGDSNIVKGWHSNKAQEEVAKQVGLTEDEFFGVVYLHQDAQHILVGGTPSERKEYLTTVFPQLQIFSSLHDLVSKRPTTKLAVDLITLQKQVQEIDKELEDPKFQQLASQSSLLERKRELRDEIISLRGALELHLKAVTLEEESKKANGLWQNYLRDYPIGEDQIVEGPGLLLAPLEEVLAQKNKEYRELLLTQQLYVQKVKLEQWLATHPVSTEKEIREEQAVITAKQAVLQNEYLLRKQLDAAEAKIPVPPAMTSEEVKGLLEETRNNIASSQIAIANAEKVIVGLKQFDAHSSICPTCHQSLTLESAIALSTSEEAHKIKAQQLLKALSSDIQNLEKMQAEIERYHLLRSEYDRLAVQWQGEKHELSYYLSELSLLEKSLNTLQATLALALQAASFRDQLQQYQHVFSTAENVTQVEVDLQILQTQRDRLREVIAVEDKLGYPSVDPNTETSLRFSIELCESHLESTDQRLADLQSTKVKFDQLVVYKEEKLHELEYARAIVNQDTAVKYLKIAYRKMRDMQCVEVMQSLQQVLPSYMDLFFPSKSLKVVVSEEEGLPSLLLERQGKLMNPDKLSGGQRKRISVGSLLAISDIKRGAKEVNIQIFDEIFGALDAPGREAAIYVLQERRFKCDSVFVVTHEQEVLAAQWDQVWWAVLKNDESQLLCLDTVDPNEIMCHVV